MEKQYELEKWEWADTDFEKMGWHDCPIYALRFDDNICLDIDYIFKWINNGSGQSFTYWIAPATLIFENPYSFKMNIEMDFINGIEIGDVLKEENDSGQTLWKILAQEGEILIGAEKYRQIIRRPPSFQFMQYIPYEERGEISFSLKSEMDYQHSVDVLNKRNNKIQLYRLVKEKRSLTDNKDELDATLLGTKDYLIAKRRIEARISEIEKMLLNTELKNY